MDFDGVACNKSFKNQIDYENHAQTLINPLVEGELRFGSARAWGLEFFVKKSIVISYPFKSCKKVLSNPVSK